MKRYKVARELDLYVDYYVIKAANMINDCFRYNKSVSEAPEGRYNALSALQADLILLRYFARPRMKDIAALK